MERFMDDKLRMTFNVPVDEDTIEQSLRQLMDDWVLIKKGYKFKLESVSFNILTYKE